MAYLENEFIGVNMLRDFTTDVGNVGRRTYEAGKQYIVVESVFREMGKAAERMTLSGWNMSRAVFDLVAVNPRVSRWFTSNGLDTWHLESGKKTKVPSNLAVFLVKSGYAEAV